MLYLHYLYGHLLGENYYVLKSKFQYHVSLSLTRLEYEKKRDMDLRIKELESSLNSLENNLKNVQKKESEAKVAAEKTTSEINRLKEEVQGMALFLTI